MILVPSLVRWMRPPKVVQVIDLWQLSDTEWLLALRRPGQSHGRNRARLDAYGNAWLIYRKTWHVDKERKFLPAYLIMALLSRPHSARVIAIDDRKAIIWL